MEHLLLIYLLKVVIVHTYVSLPEGNPYNGSISIYSWNRTSKHLLF